MMTMMHLGSLSLCIISVHVMCVITSVLCLECQSEIQLNSNRHVASIIVGSSQLNTYDVNDLFEFDNIERSYCAPGGSTRPFAMKISYRSPVLLTKIGMHGDNNPLGFVTNFSLSFSEDGDKFTDYVRNTKSSIFTMSSRERHPFLLSPTITTSSLRITINDWSIRPCMGLLMLGCNFNNLVDDSSVISNRTVSGTSSQVDDMTMVVTSIKSVLPTESTITQTVTESLTIYHTITVTDLYCTPSSSLILSPSPTQSSDTADSTSCSSSDTDNKHTMIYVAVAIVIVGLLIPITVVVVGVILCRRHQKEKGSDKSSVPLNVKYKNANDIDTGKVSVVEVDNDLYGRAIRPKLKSCPVNLDENEHTLYDEVNATKKEPAVMETADNPQYYEATMKQSDAAADPKSNENIYSYAIP